MNKNPHLWNPPPPLYKQPTSGFAMAHKVWWLSIYSKPPEAKNEQNLGTNKRDPLYQPLGTSGPEVAPPVKVGSASVL